MNKIILFFVMSLLIMNSCLYDKLPKTECNSDNPMEDFAWLKVIKSTMTNCSCEISIIQGTYNNQTVFFVALTDELCDGIDSPTLYDCEGKVVRVFNSTDYREFNDHVTRDIVLYRCKTAL